MEKNVLSKFWFFLLLTVMGCLPLIQCGKSSVKASQEDEFDVRFTLPGRIEAAPEGLVEFSVNDGKAPLQSDVFMMTGTDGISFNCVIESVSSDKFSVRLSKSAVSGSYQVFLKRGQRKKSCGTTTLSIVKSIDFTPDKTTTVWGVVTCDEKGVPGVVVSDGELVAKTDSRGIYQLPSAKKWNYVFISVPSGYEVPSKGVLPQFHAYLGADASSVERQDFELTYVGDQSKHKMLFLGDMHLANRNNDKSQFAVFAKDFNSYRKSHKSEKVYAMTLGDMTWDIYWYKNKYAFPEYLDEINGQVSGIQIFHTMGNHDNDYELRGAIGTFGADYDASARYVREIAPTYYSFNIGKVHYVVLDDIDCSKYVGDNRDYVKTFTSEQLEWLEKDLSFVDKSTPLILTTHAQIFSPIAGDTYKTAVGSVSRLFDVLKGYKVHFVTGHTHVIYNINPTESARFGAENLYEHNAGSICGSWWWSGSLTPGVYVGTDGSPAGYSIWDINGTDLKWKFKATAWDENYQFRSYDLNNVRFSYDDVPNMAAGLKPEFSKYVDEYSGAQKNQVLINIWNWNSNWKLSVADEDGNELEWTRTSAYDPLHIAALTVKRFNGASSKPNFITERWHHFFKVTAPDADTDLTIKVTDEFGNVYTENMARPKEFKVDDFKK